MFVLYFGGQKSGKSKLAEIKAINLSKNKTPYYIATYNNSFNDKQMIKKINKHKIQRGDKFKTIQEYKNLPKNIKNNQTYIIDCISMWIFNNLNKKKKFFIQQLKQLKKTKTNIIFVLNDTNNGVVPIDKQSRKFVDTTGVVGQYLSDICHKVYEVKFGIAIKIKG